MSMLSLLKRAEQQGVYLFVEEGLLGFRLTVEEFPVELKKELVANKPALIDFLTQNQQSHETSAAKFTSIPKADSEKPYLTSFAQQRMWFIEQIDQGNSQYNITSQLRISGSFDLSAAQQAFVKVIARHQPLRTGYLEAGHTVEQRVHEEFDFKLHYIDLKNRAMVERVKVIEKEVAAHSAQKFDLCQGLMLRVSYLRESDEQGILLICVHHIAADGWSMEILLREFQVYYKSILENVSEPLPPLNIQYVDFAQWQRQRIQENEFDAQVKYWQQHLQDIPVVHSLPLDNIRPKIKQHAGQSVSGRLSTNIANSLHHFARKYQMSEFMLLHAALGIVLSRHSNTKDIVVGTPVANRLHTDLEGLIGLFVNTLVLRLDTDYERLEDYLAHTRDIHLNAQSNQDVPFEQLVELLAVPRSSSHTPLFQIMLTTNTDYAVGGTEHSLSDITVNSLTTHNISVKFDLEIDVTFSPESIEVHWRFDSHIFSESRVAKLNEHLCNVLTQWARVDRDKDSAPSMLDDFSILSSDETYYLTRELNERTADFPQDKCIHELFEDVALTYPDKIALALEASQLSYQALNDKANQVASYLREHHSIMPNTKVGLYTERSFEMVIGILGILKAGGGYVPLDPQNPCERLAYILDDAAIEVVLSQQSLVDTPALVQRTVVALDSEVFSGYSTQNLSRSKVYSPEQLAYLIYTSGSTGKPKGVITPHRAVIRLVHKPSFMDLDHTTTFLQSANVAFDAATMELWGPLLNGGKCVLYQGAVTDLPSLNSTIRKHQVTSMWLTAGLFSQWSEGCDGLPSLKWVLAGGDVVRAADVRRVQQALPLACVINGYGPTENTTFSCCYPVGVLDKQAISVPIGKVINGDEAYVLDGLQLVPYGAIGELCVGGAGLAKGYLNQDALTAEQFIDNPYYDRQRKGSSRYLYRTGDLVRYVEGGNLEFIGRLDGQVKIRGFRVELDEIIHQLGECQNVDSAIVLIKRDTAERLQLTAYIKLNISGFDGNSDEAGLIVKVKKALSATLPDYMIPSTFVVVDEWPLTANGKIDRGALPEPDVRLMQESIIKPSTPTELQLAQILARLLDLNDVEISATANFFEIGGHSLLLISLLSEIKEIFSIELTIRDVYDHPVLSDLAKQIEDAESLHCQQPISRVTHIGAEFELSSIQKRLWIMAQLGQGSNHYSIPFIAKVKGEFDECIAEKAFTRLIERHYALRTVYKNTDGSLSQKVLDPFTFNLATSDLRGLPEIGQSDPLDNIVTDFLAQQFDLERELMLRAAFIRLDDNAGVLAVNMHHIASDAWSIDIIMSEFTSIYDSLKSGAEANLAELDINYGDYVSWEQNYFQSDKFARKQAFWTKQLEGAPQVHQVPLDRPRGRFKTFEGAVHRVSHDAKSLRSFSASHNVSLFMLLHAVFSVLLARYSNQRDIVVGTSVANRNHNSLGSVVGCFINTLVLRTRIEGDPSFVYFLEQVKNVDIDALEHQQFPFEQLVEQLDGAGDKSHSPLFQIMFSLNRELESVQSITGYEIAPVSVNEVSAKYDLSLNIIETQDKLELCFEYNRDLFDNSTISRMASHYTQLLQSVMRDPQLSIFQLDMLSPMEVQKLVAENIENKLVPSQFIQTQFEAQVLKTPVSIALVEASGRELSYLELNQKANRLAHYLVARGVKVATFVGISTERTFDMVVGILAIIKAGGAYIPLDPSYPQERLNYIIEDSGLTLMLCQQEYAARFNNTKYELICFDDIKTQDKIAGLSEKNLPLPNDSAKNVPMYMIYTSGSTGQPKGVALSHGNCANFISSAKKTLYLQQGVWLAITSLSFDISVLELFGTLLNGFKVVIAPAQEIRSGLQEKPRQILDFGLFYFSSSGDEHQNNIYKLLMEGAKYADLNGFSTIWTPERHFNSFGGLYPNPGITGAAIAAVTEHVQIRAGSCVLPLNNPVRIAEDWSVIDNLSSGRVGVAFASGWNANDFALAPENFEQRHQVLFDGINTIQSLWNGETISQPGPQNENVEIKLYPAPVQDSLPVWITAASNPATFKKAGEIGANVLTHMLGQTLGELKENINVYHQARLEAGFHGEGNVTLMLHTFIADEEETVLKHAKAPFKAYLATSLALTKHLEQELKDKTSDEIDISMDDVLELAFTRYYHSASLIGTPQKCNTFLSEIQSVGVTEIGCLLDFGIDSEVTLASLPALTALKDSFNEGAVDHKKIPVTDSVKQNSSIGQLIEEHQVTHLQCTPSLASMLITDEENKSKLGLLHQLMIGGENFPTALLQQLGEITKARIFNLYGPTEACVWATCAELVPKTQKVTIGQALPGYQIYIVDQYLNLVPEGVVGELLIAGDSIALGYHNQAAMTQDRFIINPFDLEGSSRAYRTGDRVKQLANGQLEYIGRGDSQIKFRGYRIELGEIDSLLNRFTGIKQAAVILREDTQDKAYLAAYISVEHVDDITDEFKTAIKQYLQKQLPGYMVPSVYDLLDVLPLTPNGKIDRLALEKKESLLNDVQFKPAVTDTQVMLTAIYAKLLKLDVERISISANFFELGGHSLLAVRLIAEIWESSKVELQIHHVFEFDSLANLAALIDQESLLLRSTFDDSDEIESDETELTI